MKAKEILKVLIDKILSLKNRSILKEAQTENVPVQDETEKFQPNNDILTQNIQEEYKPDFEISLEENNGVLKLEISDYVTIQDYNRVLQGTDKLKKVDDNITFNVLWNGDRQCISKGTYYSFSCDIKSYNILINDDFIMIHERTKNGEETGVKTISIYKDFRFGYSRWIDNKFGSSRDTQYYGNTGSDYNYEIMARVGLLISPLEFKKDLNSMLSSLKTFPNIETIIDINLIRNQIMKDLEVKTLERKNKYTN